MLFARGLDRAPASNAGTLSLAAEPLTATLLGTVFLSERWSPTTIAGAATLALELALTALRSTRSTPTHATAPAAIGKSG